MRIKKILLITGFLAIFALLIPCSHVLAGAGIEPPPDGVVFTGPEIWGVVVMLCGPSVGDDYAVIRFKRVVDCNVETQALFDLNGSLGCPSDAAGAVGHTLPEGTSVFGQTTPYITNVKNFKIEGDIVSFDAQFKYWHRP